MVGWMLPGKGLLLDGLDKDRLGITRDMPYVYDYSPFARKRDYFMRRFRDLHRSELGAITTYDDIINARANGKARDIAFNKASITTAAGFWYDTFVCTGTGGAGVFLATTAPTDVALTRATTGALNPGLPDPGGSDKAYILSFGMSLGSAQLFGLLIDRHIQGGSYRLSVDPTEVTATPDTVTRNYGGGAGQGAEMIATVTTARATPGAGTLTVNYLDSAAAASASPAVALGATADPVNRLLTHGGTGDTSNPFLKQKAAANGVTQIVNTDRAAALDTTGVVAISIVQPLIWVPALAVANLFIERDMPSDLTGLVELANVTQVTGCLGLLVLCNTTTLGAVTGFLRTCQG